MVNRIRKNSTPQKSNPRELVALFRSLLVQQRFIFCHCLHQGKMTPKIYPQDSRFLHKLFHMRNGRIHIQWLVLSTPILKKYVQVKVGTFSLQQFILVDGGPNIVLKAPPRTSQEMILIWPNFEHLLNLRPALIQEKNGRLPLSHISTKDFWGSPPSTKNTIFETSSWFTWASLSNKSQLY